MEDVAELLDNEIPNRIIHFKLRIKDGKYVPVEKCYLVY
jgi:hypothetical protein